MDTPWKVVGFEKFLSEKGAECVRLYVARPLILPDDSTGEGLESNRLFYTGEGLETNRLFYKPEYVQYTPVIGHMIIAQDGRYGISRIFVVGTDNGK